MDWNTLKNLLMNLDDPVLKLEFVIDLGKSLNKIPENATCTEIKGCASLVKICNFENRFYAFADSEMVRGLIAIILNIIENKSIDEIKEIDILSEFNSLDLNIGAGRVNGINSVISFLKNL